MEHVQYAALTDLEGVVKELAKISGKPVAIIYDPKLGWCMSDEVVKGGSRHGPSEPSYTVQTYGDWFSATVAGAAQVAFGVRFLPGTLIGRLFRKQNSYSAQAQTADKGKQPKAS